MDIETQVDEPVDDSVRNDLENAFNELDKPSDQVAKPDDKAAESRARDDSGKFAKKTEDKPVETTAPAQSEKTLDPPRSWTAAEKAEWATMTPAQRSAVMRRESEVELGFTKLDEDRNFGKSIKETLQPYMAIIQAEGGTPVTAIQSLLNTAYVLRTASTEQKTALFHQLAQQYGVDLSKSNTISAAQPDALAQTQQELADLKKQIAQQPEVFRQQQENLAIKSQIDAFAADPKNVHYEKLKPVMASLLQTGGAKDLQDAYDKASWADPEIRSAMNSDQHKASETQRIADIKAKADNARKAAVSVRGTPGVTPAANGKSNGSIADDLRAAWDEHA